MHYSAFLLLNPDSSLPRQFYPFILMPVRIGAEDQKGFAQYTDNFRSGSCGQNSSGFPPLQEAAVANPDLYQLMGGEYRIRRTDDIVSHPFPAKHNQRFQMMPQASEVPQLSAAEFLSFLLCLHIPILAISGNIMDPL